MRQLLPEVLDDVDPRACYAADARPPHPDRPWVLVNMVASVDGATTVDGVSGPLGGAADKAVFGAIRGVADAILVGAATVRAEQYGTPRAHGDRPPPRIAVVTRSGELDTGLRLFTAPPAAAGPPLVVTCEACPAARRRALAEVAEVVVAGDAAVDLAGALAALADRGAGVVLAEGGPTLNGQLIAAGLVDEWCITIAAVLAGGRSSRPAVGDAPAAPVALRLDRLLEADGALFARYVRLDSSVISAAKSDRSSNPL